MSASDSSNSPSNTINLGSSHKGVLSKEELEIQRKRQPTPSRPQAVDHFTSREVVDRSSDPGVSIISTPPSQIPHTISRPTPMNHGHGDARQSRGNLDSPISPIAHRFAEGVVQREEVQSMPFFQGSSNVKIDNSNFNEIHGNATIIRFGDGQFTEVQRNLICDFIANHANLPDINHNLNRHFLTQSIRNLPRAEAVFDDYQTKKKSGPCFEGTRVALLREMADWATGEGESRMYVLSGLAGIGKSTVAYTIASRAADLNLLGASFFFSRDEGDRKNAKKFFTTIAYQLCLYSKTFAEAIGNVLQTDGGSAITKGPREQLQALIVDPLQNIVQSRARPILVVVDALDECDKEDRFSVLSGLRKLVQDLPSFKVILTTRPQPYLDRFFANQDGHKYFRLQDIENKVVDYDIWLYLKHWLSLEQIQKHFPTRKWCASDKEIDSLVRAAGRLFIIASTTVRYILDKVASNPATQMKKLLYTFVQDRMPFRDLDAFYTVILRNVAPVNCDDDIVDRYKAVVGAIITVQYPLPVPTLARLVDIDEEEIRAVIVNLQSVIRLGDDDIPRIYHKSLPDYITDSERCKDDSLHIDPMVRHMRITIRCFQMMEQHLKYNILNLGTPARFMSNEDGLQEDGIADEQLERKIPPQLQYACAYWAIHLEATNIEDADLMKELEQFANQHMLHWFEVLSLIRKLDSSHRAIRIVLKVLKSTSLDLHQILLDGLRFISKFYGTIETSALHTYYSALSFTPRESLLYRRYIKEAAHSVCSIEGGPSRWDALVATCSHGEWVDILKFSLDNTTFASLSKRALNVWDAVTGTPVSMISGGDFAIANDFSTITSFKDNVITLYDVDGNKRGALFTTRANIVKVAISSESSRIAAISSDQTLWLWDSVNGELLGNFTTTQYWAVLPRLYPDRNRLQFSATGDRLACSLHDNHCVHLRNGTDGSFIANLNCYSSVDCMEFSADGSRIATLSWDALSLWSCENSKAIGIAQNSGHYLAISANGTFLATTYEKGVVLWSGDSGHPLPQIEDLRLDSFVSAFAFSLNNILAVSVSSGIKLYNVKTRSFISTLSINDSTALAFSPDSTRLAAGSSRSKTVCLWDIQDIEASSPFLNEQGIRRISALALSQDCSRVVCGFSFGEVKLWETGSLGEEPISAHTHHMVSITTLVYSPDSKRFASGSCDGIINLWDGKGGSLCGTLQVSGWVPRFRDRRSAVEVSNTVLAVAGHYGIGLWNLITLDHIHTFYGSFEPHLSFSADGALLACVRRGNDNASSDHTSTPHQTIIFDVTKRTIISTLKISNNTMAFLPDNSHITVRAFDDRYYHSGELYTFNLVNGELEQGPTLEHFMQLRNKPLWHSIPVSIRYGRTPYLEGSFSEHARHVPVLWIPEGLHTNQIIAEGRSAIALASTDSRITLLRILTGPLG